MNDIEKQIEQYDWKSDWFSNNNPGKKAPLNVVRAKLIKETGWNDKVYDQVIKTYKEYTKNNGEDAFCLSDKTINILKQKLLPPHFVTLLWFAYNQMSPDHPNFEDIYSRYELSKQIRFPYFTPNAYGRKVMREADDISAADRYATMDEGLADGIANLAPRIDDFAINLYTDEFDTWRQTRDIRKEIHAILHHSDWATAPVGFPKFDDSKIPDWTSDKALAEIEENNLDDWWYKDSRYYYLKPKDAPSKAIKGVLNLKVTQKLFNELVTPYVATCKTDKCEPHFCLSFNALMAFAKLLHPLHFGLALKLVRDYSPLYFKDNMRDMDNIIENMIAPAFTEQEGKQVSRYSIEYDKCLEIAKHIPPRFINRVAHIYEYEYNIYKQRSHQFWDMLEEERRKEAVERAKRAEREWWALRDWEAARERSQRIAIEAELRARDPDYLG